MSTSVRLAAGARFRLGLTISILHQDRSSKPVQANNHLPPCLETSFIGAGIHEGEKMKIALPDGSRKEI
ncbi:MAG: hypothetical protein M0Q43_13875, partial [Methanothrix sp.]|nr:hypothetical protein [Methanothrix sp.]